MKKEDLVKGEQYEVIKGCVFFITGEIVTCDEENNDYPFVIKDDRREPILISKLKPYKQIKMRDMKFRVHSPEHSKAIQEQLFKLGFSWLQGQELMYLDGDQLFANSNDLGYASDSEFYNNSTHKETTLDDLYKLNQPPKPVEVKLNDEYTAIITDDKVKVGCQEFTHEVINELHKAINK